MNASTRSKQYGKFIMDGNHLQSYRQQGEFQSGLSFPFW